MTAPGWYDDPHGSGNLRYWDGNSWTEHLQSRTGPPPQGSGSGGAPPFQPPPGAGPGSGPGNAPDPRSLFSSPAITGWANGTVAVISANLKELAILSFLIPFPFFVVTYVFIDQIFRRAQWSDISGEFEGINTVMIGLSIASALVTMIVTLACSLATAHYTHEAFVGRPPATWADSLRAVGPRVPKFFGISLLIVVVIYLAIGLPIGLMIYGIVSDRLGFLAFGIAIPFLVIFLIWFLVKVAFVQVSAAVAPSGTSAFAASWGLGRGRFWPMFGRLAIVYALSGVFGTITQIISQTLSPYVIFSGVDRRDNGFGQDILVDGQRIETLDVLPLGELLPNPLLIVIFLALTGLAQAANQTVVTTAIAGLYSEMGGPSRIEN